MEKLFRILEITSELVEDIRNRPNEAHWHDFEEIIILTQGGLEHFIDFAIEEVNAPAICYVSMGKTHRLIPASNLRGWLINFKNELIPDSKLVFYSNYFTTSTIPMSSGICINNYDTICRLIYSEYKQEFFDLTVISHLVNALIAMIDVERKRSLPIESTAKSSQINTFAHFLKILDEHYKRDEGVSFYAEKLNMTERNLNTICHNVFQKSVSEIIEIRKLTEAKKLLLNTDKSISEIGYELGYNEKSYFTRVFHHKMGMTPSHFREQTRGLIMKN